MSVDYGGVMLAVGILALLVLLFIGRALVMWWLGINPLIAQQKETNALLSQYLEAQSAVPEPTTEQRMPEPVNRFR